MDAKEYFDYKKNRGNVESEERYEICGNIHKDKTGEMLKMRAINCHQLTCVSTQLLTKGNDRKSRRKEYICGWGQYAAAD